jgi:benzoyl-CoA reductase subunit BamC
VKRVIKTIKIDTKKCTGCRVCEAMCSAYHAEPRYGIVNAQRSRIRVFWDEENALFVPVMAGQYTDAECNGRSIVLINAKEYGECSFCRASCPSRDLFKEPVTGIPLKCDICGEPMPEGGPSYVRWCSAGALIYHETEEEMNVRETEEETEVEEIS